MTEDLAFIQRYTDALQHFDRLGGHDFKPRAATMASELGFSGLDAPVPIACQVDNEPEPRSPYRPCAVRRAPARRARRTTSTPTNSDRLEAFVAGFSAGSGRLPRPGVPGQHREPVRRTGPVHPSGVRVRRQLERVCRRSRAPRNQAGKPTMLRWPSARGCNARAEMRGEASAGAGNRPNGRTSPTSTSGPPRRRERRSMPPAPPVSSASWRRSTCPTRLGSGGNSGWTWRRPRAAATWWLGSPPRWSGEGPSSWDRSTSRSPGASGSRSWDPTVRGSRRCCTRSPVTSR